MLDATNSDGTGWGGYLFGTKDVNDTSQRTRTIWTTENDVYREVPKVMTCLQMEFHMVWV